MARKAGLLEAELSVAHPRLDAIPFESEHQFMATLHGGGAGRLIYKKGAAERIIERCTTSLDDHGELVPFDKAHAREAVEHMATKGLRVLAFARRHVASDHARLEHGHVAGDLTFLGLQGMIDPPRPEAIAAVRRCRSAGIRVKMITGDHLATARAIASQIGLDDSPEPHAVSGRELERLSGDALADAAERTAVFARVAPEQKLLLVQALQSHGHVVAMTGDGVNDAPALKQADIGVAMGRGGTEVAKGAADMVLTDDNFATIEAAVEEGRCVFDNLNKFIVWTLPTNVGEAMIVLWPSCLGVTLPALPVQLLWINMTTSVLLGMTLAFETREPGMMERPPRDPRQPLLTFPLFMRTGLVSLLTLGGAFGLFVWENSRGASLAEARTAVANVIVFVQLFYLFNCRSLAQFLVVAWCILEPLAARRRCRDDRRSDGVYLCAVHERSLSLRSARCCRLAAGDRRRVGRVADCRLREMGPRPRRKKTRRRPEHPAASTAKLTMRTTTPQKQERVHDIFRERRPALETMLAPKSVAVIGATEAEGSVGRTLMENLKAGNFGGEIIPVNLKRARVLGIAAFPKVGAVKNPIDLAVIVTPAATVPGIIGECVEAGVKGAIIISAGFKECGAAGVELEKQVLTQARRGRMRIIGPNCLGVMRPHAGLNATFAASMARPGSVGFISQSGALCTAILDWSLRRERRLQRVRLGRLDARCGLGRSHLLPRR